MSVEIVRAFYRYVPMFPSEKNPCVVYENS